MKTEHTKALYSVESSFDDCLRLVATTKHDKREIARFSTLISEKQADEIVRCVNERDALVAALTEYMAAEDAHTDAMLTSFDESKTHEEQKAIQHRANVRLHKAKAACRAALQSPAPGTK